MTRKRVGQGLIEAFSTTCDSCGGRGIHIHTDPVKVKPSMPFEEIAVASRALVEEELLDADPHLSMEVAMAEAEVESVMETKPATNSQGRRRRRAVSTGVVTPGA
jgi:ribonuclease E